MQLPRAWWLPDTISDHAQAYDGQLNLTLLITGIIFLFAQALLIYVLLRYRNRGQQAIQFEGNNQLEITWTIATAIVFVGLAIAGQSIWASTHMDSSPAQLRVEVLAKQFQWSFRYPGADAKFGRTDLRQIDDSGGNPFGVDFKDPAGRDDIMVSALKVPSGVVVELAMVSRDVLHNFFVRELRIKQDIVPGMVIPLRFKANVEGEYEVPCSELCGLGHHQMRTTLTVLSPEGFAQWLREEQKRLVP